MVVFLGIYWLVDGIINIVQIFTKTSNEHWGWLLVKGILGIIAGLYALKHPFLSTILVPSIMIIFLGVNGLILGVMGLVEAFKGAGWGAGILGAVNILFGLILIFNPVAGTLASPWVLAFWPLLAGLYLLYLLLKSNNSMPASAQ